MSTSSGESLSVVIGAQADPLIKGLKDAENALNSFGRNTQSAMAKVSGAAGILNDLFGVGLAGGVGFFIKNTIESVSALGYQAQQLGISVEKLQALQLAAEETGVSNEDLNNGLDKLSKTLGEAQSGVLKSQDIFTKWGIAIRDSNGNALGLDTVLKEVADRFASINDPALRSAAATELMGRSAYSMINFLSQGSKAMESAEQRAQSLGAIIGGDVVKQMQAAETQIDITSKVISVNLTEALAKALPFLTKLSEGVKFIVTDFEALAKGASETIDLISGMAHNFNADYDTRPGGLKDLFYDTMQQMDKKNPGLLTPAAQNVGVPGIDQVNSIGSPSSGGSGFQPGNPAATRALSDYLQKLQQLHDANSTNARDQAIQQAVDEAENIARTQGVKVTQDYVDAVKAAAGANYDLQQQVKETTAISNELSTDIVNQFQKMTESSETFGQALRTLALDFVNLLEKMLVQEPMQQSLARRLGGVSGGSGLLSGGGDFLDSLFGTGAYAPQYSSPIGPTVSGAPQGFASGGMPPVGVPSIVGEEGPELFIPNTAGTIIPNGALNGGGVQLVQHVHFSATDSNAIQATVMNMLPQIASASKAAVADAYKRGGKFAKALGG